MFNPYSNGSSVSYTAVSSNVDVSHHLSHISINKSRLKSYHVDSFARTFYLNDGTEFEIELFNPYTENILASISIDGVEFERDIFIKPGERVWLDRFLNQNKKFIFNTYEVEANNAEVDNAIRNNGQISIVFYTCSNIGTYVSQVRYPDLTWTNITTTPASNIYDIYDWQKYSNGTNALNCNGDIRYRSSCTCGNADPANNISSTFSCHSSSSIKSAIPTRLDSIDTTIDSNISYETKETGRVETSENKSKLNFHEVNLGNFSKLYFKTERISLKPLSEQPVTKSNLVKKYCSNCGKKIKTSYKYCPICGTKIN